MKRLGEAGGLGGLIAMSPRGEVSFVFNTEGMYRGVVDSQGQARVAIYGDEQIPGDHESNGGTAWEALA